MKQIRTSLKRRRRTARFRHVCLAVYLTLLLHQSIVMNMADAATSLLWGSSGEQWQPRGRLPDYSYAGYHSGERSLPRVTIRTRVENFGAIANDSIDDSAAIQAAIDATPVGAIAFGRGVYRLEKAITINRSGIVLRGAGDSEDGTVFDVPFNATERNGGVHDMRFSWGISGFIIAARGDRSHAARSVTASQSRGDRQLTLENTDDIQTGDAIVLRLDDEQLYGSLFRHLHNDRLDGWDRGSASTWCGADGRWTFTVESVSGDSIGLKEPLPFDVRAVWNPQVELSRAVAEVGIEDLRIRFRNVDPPDHLTERGYNGINFEYVRNSWIRNVTVEDADNGFTIGRNASKNTLSDIRITGRRGHHAASLSAVSYNLIDGMEIQVDDGVGPWIHGVTIDHVSQGNVVQRVVGNKEIRMDLHRDSPFENLYTEILSAASLKSSGDQCAGPHTGARLTVWNVFGQIDDIDSTLLADGVDSQVNIVSRTDRDEFRSDDGLWIENLRDIDPPNLYKAQLARRLAGGEPEVRILASGVNESEGEVDIRLVLSKPAERKILVGVNTVPGSALNGRDFYGISRTIEIRPGQNQVRFAITVLDDTEREGLESFLIRIHSVAGATAPQLSAPVFIEDNDIDTPAGLSIDDAAVTEGERLTFRVSLSHKLETPVSVWLYTQPQSASNGEDYYGVYSELEIPAGQTGASVDVTTVDDTLREGIETVLVQIVNPTGAVLARSSGEISILDND